MPSPPPGHAARLVLAVALCALALVLAPAAGASAADAWTARPGVSGSGAGGRPYVYLEGPPGAVLHDRLSVTNPGRSPVTVRLSGSGLGGRLRTAAAEVTVPARTRADVPFIVTVPTTAPPGDRPGAIAVRGGGRSADVRVRLRVAGPTLAALTVEDVAVSGRLIHYTLVNRGNAVLAPRLAVRADGVFGPLLRRPARDLPVRVRPGGRVRLTEPWRERPAFDSATVRLAVGAAGGAHDEATVRAVSVPWAPLTAGALLALTGAGAGAYALRRRRARGRRPDDGEGRRPDGEQSPPAGEELRPVGREHSRSRHVAKAGAES
ncbi:COG1470 family protein [Streptomyces sp. NPDC001274]